MPSPSWGTPPPNFCLPYTTPFERCYGYHSACPAETHPGCLEIHGVPGSDGYFFREFFWGEVGEDTPQWMNFHDFFVFFWQQKTCSQIIQNTTKQNKNHLHITFNHWKPKHLSDNNQHRHKGFDKYQWMDLLWWCCQVIDAYLMFFSPGWWNHGSWKKRDRISLYGVGGKREPKTYMTYNLCLQRFWR